LTFVFECGTILGIGGKIDMPNVIKCNRCAVDNCTRADHIEDSSRCSYFMKLDDFKRPMLMHLLAEPKKIKGLMVALSFANLRIREINYYPFFKLEIGR